MFKKRFRNFGISCKNSERLPRETTDNGKAAGGLGGMCWAANSLRAAFLPSRPVKGARCAREERAGDPHPPARLAFGQKVPGIGQRRAGVVVRQNFGVAPPGRRQGVRSTLTHPHTVAVPSDGKNDLPALHRD